MPVVLEENLNAMETKKSIFEQKVRELKLEVCDAFMQSGKLRQAEFVPGEHALGPASDDVEAQLPHLVTDEKGDILEAKPRKKRVSGKRIAVMFSGGPAAGGHNVLAGIGLLCGKDNTVFGVRQGPRGLLDDNLFEIKPDELDDIINRGGFDFLGSDRTKIKTPEQYKQIKAVVKRRKLDGLVIIGGDDSNTNAAFLANFLKPLGCSVVGVPKTIDGDLQVGKHLPITFGFDTATKIYSELVGNILQDTPSSMKYWHFIKLMGRSASHVALEVALQTRPAKTLISEEIFEKQVSLNEVIEDLAYTIAYRAAKGIRYGVIIVPEGLIEFIPEFKQLIAELDDVVKEYEQDLKSLIISQKRAFVETKLTQQSAKLMGSLPELIKNTLLLDRDSHGNLQVSHIPTEKLLIEMTTIKIAEMKNHPDKYFGADKFDLSAEEVERFQAFSFSTNSHFFGYEGRCGAPTRFDGTFTFNLGLIAASLILDGKTGYMAAMTDLHGGGRPIAIPLTRLLTQEIRQGKASLVIKKALVDLHSRAFKYFSDRRSYWAKQDSFVSPGPRQLWGPTANQLPLTVALNQHYETLTYKIGA